MTADTAELNDADKAVLAGLLHQVIAADPVPLSPRVQRLRAILAKLEPPPPRPQPHQAPKPAGTPSLLLSRKKGRRR